MKQLLRLAIVASLVSCISRVGTSKTGGVVSKTDSTERSIASPYPIQYSAHFGMGNPKNAEDLLTIWKVWDSGYLAAYKDLFADTVEMHFSDGSVVRESRDRLTETGNAYRKTLAKVVSSVRMIMPVKCIDKNECWALIWGKEVDTYKDGKVDSFLLQETWRFNNGGKADLVFQYKSAAAMPDN